jgi:hypothetical protein
MCGSYFSRRKKPTGAVRTLSALFFVGIFFAAFPTHAATPKENLAIVSSPSHDTHTQQQ